METAWWLVIAVRLAVPLLVLRNPLGGSVAGLMVDNLDVITLHLLGAQNFSGYNTADKYLDIWLHLLQGYVMLTWDNKIARRTGAALLTYRIVGTVVFEATGQRWILAVFPNVFEFYFLAYLIARQAFDREIITSWRRAAILVALLAIPKLAQEWYLHILRG